MGIIEDIATYVESYSLDDSLGSLLKRIIERQLISQPPPSRYYYVTELVNPAQAYYARIYPNIIKPPALARKLARGKQLQSMANVWFRNLPDFIVEEGIIDGAWVNIPRVRGKIDYRIGDSIIEFKTKDILPENSEDIINLYPQDLEQLLFYSIIHPNKPKIDYLIFMENTFPYSLKAFKIGINNEGTIKNILLNRIKALDQAISSKDPSRLGKCRYYGDICQFRNENICICESLEAFDITNLRKSIEISIDKDFTEKLIQSKSNNQKICAKSFSTLDIIAPRKHYMELILGLEDTYRDDSREEYKACLWASIGKLIREHDIELNKAERQEIIESQIEPRLRIGFKWLKMKSSIKPPYELVPYLMVVNLSNQLSTSPSLYHITELGIISATFNKNKGLIIRLYPNLNKTIQVFQIIYKNIREINKIVKKVIDEIEKAERENNLMLLPPCPSFMCNKNCPLSKECDH